MVADIVVLIRRTLLEKYSIPLHQSNALHLDGSYQKKFSMHIIFPSVVFPFNQHCGGFVKNLRETEGINVLD